LKNEPPVTIVIPTVNNERFIDSLMTTLLKTNYSNFEIVVIDNGSKDNTRRKLFHYASQSTKIRLILKEKLDPLARNWNDGIKLSKAKYVVLANDDLKFSMPKWLTKLVEAMESDPNICGANPSFLDWVGKDVKTMGLLCGPFPPLRIHLTPSMAPYFPKDYGKKLDTRNEPLSLWVLYGALMILRMSTLEEVGILDEDYAPIFGEEIDLVWRMRLAGYKVVTVPESFVRHYFSSTTSRMGSKLIEYDLRHLINSDIKNLKASNFVSIPLFVFCHIINSLLVPYPMSYIFNAIKWNVKNMRWTLLKRRNVQQLRRVDDKFALSPKAPLSALIRRYIEYKRKINWASK